MNNSPGQIAEHVLAVETVYARCLREEATLAIEYARPRVEQYVALGVDHRQIVVAGSYDGIEILRTAIGLDDDGYEPIRYEALTSRVYRLVRNYESVSTRFLFLPGGQEHFECAGQAGPPGLAIARKVGSPQTLQVTVVRLVQGGHSQL